ncbi:DUF1028 domain-containing protein [Actinobacteria bacterium YIM 96077]|uniref:DUF1028 domain-containing protein n=1 Tax=Phytoactinopolyspora halophila TaxID=1981511 RepID=A0A329QT82_9ACTN|nr:DUF1028 domain-containing protein [Phytoactinopolyspora halophila]AYY14986.1 DUF1028 domain-containing protein [Actinobacteria bacterium YIM 96077]RAW15443.1 DUF1028 domain-containing protein [Phytoactinopolyspora halophila]
MTYSIIAREPETGYMGVATQSQAFAVGSSVPWTTPGYGLVATQSMGEPMYGELGLDALRAGLTAAEALKALTSVDPHPERRQVGMVDAYGHIEVYTGDACVSSAGHLVGDTCASLANMVRSPHVWESMVDAYERSTARWLPRRLVAALQAAEDAGGDERGRRSAAILVVRAERSGRPWRDTVTDLRIDDHSDPIGEIHRMVEHNWRYHRTVTAFEYALDGNVDEAIAQLPHYTDSTELDPDLVLWRAIILAAAGRMEEARALGADLGNRTPEMVTVARRFGDVGLVDPAVLARIFPDPDDR